MQTHLLRTVSKKKDPSRCFKRRNVCCFFLQSHTNHVVCKEKAPSLCLKRVKLITFFLQITFCRFFERKMLFTQVKNDQTSSFKSSPVKYFARKALKTQVKMSKSLPPFLADQSLPCTLQEKRSKLGSKCAKAFHLFLQTTSRQTFCKKGTHNQWREEMPDRPAVQPHCGSLADLST